VKRTSSRKTALVMVVCAGLLSLLVVSPAVGGPSIGKVSAIAKRALKTGKSANKRSKTALRVARRGPLVVERSQKDIPAAPGGFAEFDVKCPGGYTAVGIGLGLGALEPVFFASYGGGALGSMFNPSGSSVFTGGAFVECVKSAGYVGSARAFRSRGQALRALRRAEQSKAAAH